MPENRPSGDDPRAPAVRWLEKVRSGEIAGGPL